MSNIREKANEAERYAKAEAIIERAYQQLVRKMHRAVSQLEAIGENEMGLLNYKFAGRFHAATSELRALAHDLTQDAYWPKEPGVY